MTDGHGCLNVIPGSHHLDFARSLDQTYGIGYFEYFELAEDLGADTYNVPTDLSLGQLAAIRAATDDGIAITAAILDELLARRTVAGRPRDLADDLQWVRAASGRSEHPDPRLPLIG